MIEMHPFFYRDLKIMATIILGGKHFSEAKVPGVITPSNTLMWVPALENNLSDGTDFPHVSNTHIIHHVS